MMQGGGVENFSGSGAQAGFVDLQGGIRRFGPQCRLGEELHHFCLNSVSKTNVEQKGRGIKQIHAIPVVAIERRQWILTPDSQIYLMVFVAT